MQCLGYYLYFRLQRTEKILFGGFSAVLSLPNNLHVVLPPKFDKFHLQRMYVTRYNSFFLNRTNQRINCGKSSNQRVRSWTLKMSLLFSFLTKDVVHLCRTQLSHSYSYIPTPRAFALGPESFYSIFYIKFGTYKVH